VRRRHRRAPHPFRVGDQRAHRAAGLSGGELPVADGNMLVAFA
jgi:hypothetical protein